MKSSVFKFIALLLLLPFQAAGAADKPNILIIWGDDIGQFNVSAYNVGMMGYRTPILSASPGKEPCSLTGTASRVVRRGALHSSLVSRRCVPA